MSLLILSGPANLRAIKRKERKAKRRNSAGIPPVNYAAIIAPSHRLIKEAGDPQELHAPFVFPARMFKPQCPQPRRHDRQSGRFRSEEFPQESRGPRRFVELQCRALLQQSAEPAAQQKRSPHGEKGRPRPPKNASSYQRPSTGKGKLPRPDAF